MSRAILPMATVATGAEKKAQLDSLGADAFVVNITRSEADDDSMRKLGTPTGIWFPGGDQSPLAASLRGSAALRTIHDRYRAGAVVGGTSAGAAVMSDSMITGNQFWPGTAAVDSPAFSRIGRRTIEIAPGVVLERPHLLGVGIDEGTALEVAPDGRSTNVRVSVLPAGSIYDPLSGVASIPQP